MKENGVLKRISKIFSLKADTGNEKFNPEADTGIKRPVRTAVAINDIYDKFSEYPSNGLNPIRLATIFKEADRGDVRRQMELFEEIEEKDTHLFSQLQTRKLAVTGLDWEIQPFSKDEIDIQVAAFVEEQFKSLTNLNDIFLDMLDAIGKGISISEIEWGVDNQGRNIIENIEWVHPKKLIWDVMTDELKICTKDYPTGVSIPKNKFVIHKYKAKSGHPSRAGVLRIVSWMYLFKNFDIKDWVAFCEVYGMPLRIGKYDASASEEDKQALFDAIMSLGSDAAGVISTSTQIEFVESQKTTSADIYEKFARYADEQMSKAILGQTLTSDSGGSYAQGKVHSDVKHDLTAADAKSLEGTVRRDIITPLVEYNFGTNVNIPFFKIECEEADDLEADVKIYKDLVGMGLEIPKNFLRKKFSIPEPKENEDVVKQMMQVLPEENSVKALKENPNGTEQDQLDLMADTATAYSEKLFREMFQPILNLIDKSESLDDVALALKDEEKLKQLYKDMNNEEFEDLLNQAMYFANVIGGSMNE